MRLKIVCGFFSALVVIASLASSPPSLSAGTCGSWPSAITAWVQPLPESTGDAFYVSPSGSDSNPGTKSLPWQTIDKPFKSLQPGQIAYIRSGTYGAPGYSYHFNRIGTPSAPITVSGYPGDPKPILRGRYYMDGQYIRLTGVIIDGPTGNVGGPGLDGEDITLHIKGSHTELSDSEVRFDQWHAGVIVYGGFDYRIISNYIHDNGGFNGDYSTSDSQWNTSHGIYASPSSYGLVANNIIEHNDAEGFMARHDANHIIIANNSIVGNGRYGISLDEQSHDFIVANNIFLNNGTIKGGAGIKTISNIYVRTERAGKRVMESITHFITKKLKVNGENSGTGGKSYVEVNNVFWNNGTSGKSTYTTGATVIEPKVVDPLLVAPAIATDRRNPDPTNDSHLKSGSPAIGYANPNYALPYDRAGACRDTSPDAGAYEFITPAITGDNGHRQDVLRRGHPVR